jgi:hypothetical protein
MIQNSKSYSKVMSSEYDSTVTVDLGGVDMYTPIVMNTQYCHKIRLLNSNSNGTNSNYCQNSKGCWLLGLGDSDQNRNLQSSLTLTMVKKQLGLLDEHSTTLAMVKKQPGSLY